MEEEEIIKVEVEKIIEEEGMTISTKEETTTSNHIIKEEVETILVMSIEEEDAITTTKKEQILIFKHKAMDGRFKHQANIAESQYGNIGENFDNPQRLFLTNNTFSEDENIWYLDIESSNHMCGKN
ncbi:hypothetical protein CR513_47002, partial [Mucuna pruriens]